MKLKNVIRTNISADNRKEKLKGLSSGLFCYIILIGIGFVYLYPILYMVIISVMPTDDLINPTVNWIPSAIDFGSYASVYKALDYSNSLFITLLLSSVSAVVQTVVCAIAGYSLARFSVPAKKLWIVILLVVFIIPAEVVSVPRYVLFNQYHLVGSLFSVYLPAILGQGLKSSLFILLFMQSFSSYPKSYDEAAQLDGAGSIHIFFRVALPLAVPIVILSLLFSFIWYWNETTQAGLLLSGYYDTLPLKLEQFDATYQDMFVAAVGNSANRLNERVQMSATILAIAPLVLLYFIVQKGMISSVESAGVTGE